MEDGRIFVVGGSLSIVLEVRGVNSLFEGSGVVEDFMGGKPTGVERCNCCMSSVTAGDHARF